MVKKLLFILIPFLLIGCKTMSVQDGEHIKDFSESVGKLEILVSEMESNSNNNKLFLDDALTKADSLESEIDKLDLLFTTYETLVNNMIEEQEQELNTLKLTLGEMKDE